MKLVMPELSLVVLVGPSGSGKSTFARRQFRTTEIISSDQCRGLVADDENDLAATNEAFEVLHFLAKKRLSAGRLTVIDATNVRAEDRAPLLELARETDVLAVAIVLDLPASVCQERNDARPDRRFGAHVVRRHAEQVRRSISRLKSEGFRYVYVLRTTEEVDAALVERQRMWNDRREDHGPFDVVGDVHGCCDELVELLERLGYRSTGGDADLVARHPEGRKAVFLGDLVDRGPASPRVLRLVMNMVAAESALCVPGNHDMKLLRKLHGKDVKVTHGLAETLEQLARASEDFRQTVARFLDGLISHYVLDDGKLVVAHAGLRQVLQGRASRRVREFALYGETTGETDEFGLPVRYDWARDYRGEALVVYGHTPVPEPEWVNRTICIDTGCVFGGRLTALRYPEKEIVQVAARRKYYEPVRPLSPSSSELADSRADRQPDLLDASDVLGKRSIETRHHPRITIRAENAAAAIEVMSRFAVDPRWLVYLPPTMSPGETCAGGPFLEHPREVFETYRRAGLRRAVCEEKHMGSRAVIVLCRDEAIARRRFGAGPGELGCVYTRTGRRFFAEERLERALLDRLAVAVERSRLWERLESGWVCFDSEILPWSAKAQELLRLQYAPAGSAAGATFASALALLARSASRGDGSETLLARFQARAECTTKYVEAYRRYCWPVRELGDLAVAPFHLLASEGCVHIDRDHVWHMETLAELCAVDAGFLRPTRWRLVALDDPESELSATSWWEEMTESGGEGMVVKPLEWIARGRRGLVQPALKCRGREYLRIIYGAEYTLPEHIERLRARSLASKRALALREYALGLEGLYRFVESEPLYRVHECVFGVLALESEPVDPRL